ncbi:WD40 repeat-like protein [Dacryopinax primogenitus]|uniref:WD40 repeat-like protein n=1 Tax=Dacryopinax primogenitus (strain DJM 731) TaxID=1858805 RepID=M5G2K6_DACPD|nr:WD40 repeat-like protein [Dacryopinax primogenitus]EJU02450.1 WD40 repeat-like protein [Dacryopinax primogenitus]
MKANYEFSNLCGTVYRQGNILFTPDGNSILSPVGNRVSVFDLVKNTSRTFSFENRKNISVLALSPNSRLLLSIDSDGRALLVNYRRGTVLHHFNFRVPVVDAQFSPDGAYISVTHGSHVQLWRTPNHLLREFAPFELHREYTGHHDAVLSITWSADSKYFLTTGRDMTARLYTVDPVEGFRPRTFAGHRDPVIQAFFSADNKTIYTVSDHGAIFTWRAKADENGKDDDAMSEDGTSLTLAEPILAHVRWGIAEKHFHNMDHHTLIVSAAFHSPSDLLVLGLSSGVFGLWEMPSFTPLHMLNVSQERISSLAINASGEWLAFGAAKLGQLLVWEWQSESYVLKQQGHYFNMNTLSYSHDGQHVATGGEDGKVKVWNASSGFCFVTFSEHTSSVSSVEFARQGQVLFSASLDGTVRAFDLVRYRNFRVFTSPTPVQFSSLAVDPSGEVVAAGSQDNFEIYMWSVQTGKLLDVFTGHEGPVATLAFSPTGNQLASGSWDGSVRLWDLYGRSRAVEPLQMGANVLAVAYRPDGKELAVATLDGQLTFFHVEDGKQVGLIEGRKDISGGRKTDDRTTAANNSGSKHFNSLAYTADGQNVLAGGNSKYVCLYDVRERVLLAKFQISQNLSLDGTEEFLDSRKVTEAGNIDGIDRQGEASDLEDRLNPRLPGAQRGDMGKRRYRQEARTMCIRFSPTGRSWAAASTEGLLIYSTDESIAFDPFDLDIDLTPQSLLEVLAQHEYLKALVMAFRLNEKPLIQRVYESIPPSDVRLLARQLPMVYVPAMLRFVADHIERSPHMEFDLVWVNALLAAHGRELRDHSNEYASVFRAMHKGISDFERMIGKLCDDNMFSLQYIIDQSHAKNTGHPNGKVPSLDMEIEVASEVSASA